MTTRKTPEGVQSVSRALDVIEVVTASGSIGVTEIGRRTGLKPSTAHGIMQTLTRRGYLARDGQKYRLGPTALALAPEWSQSTELDSHLRPILTELTKHTGAASTATILSGRDAKFVTSLPAPGIPKMHIEPIFWADPFALATGQILVAMRDSSEWNELLSHKTVAPRLHGSWRKVLEFTRSQGIGYNLSRDPRATVGVAMPVFGQGKRVVCSIGLYTSAYLAVDILSPEPLEELWKSCAKASELFGGELPKPQIPKFKDLRRHLPEQLLRSTKNILRTRSSHGPLPPTLTR